MFIGFDVDGVVGSAVDLNFPDDFDAVEIPSFYSSTSVTGDEIERTFTGVLKDGKGDASLEIKHRYRLVGNTVLATTTTVTNVRVDNKNIMNLVIWFGTQDDSLGCAEKSNIYARDENGDYGPEADDFERVDECSDFDNGYTGDKPRKQRGTYAFAGSPIPSSGADLTKFTRLANETGGQANSILIQSYNADLEDSVGGEWILFASDAVEGVTVDTRIAEFLTFYTRNLDNSGNPLPDTDLFYIPPGDTVVGESRLRNDVQADNAYGVKFDFGVLSGTGTRSKSVTWYYAVGSTRFAPTAASQAVSLLELTCTPDPVVPGALVTCVITGGDPGIDILWQASTNPVFASTGVTLDEFGRGTFTFRAPRGSAGQTIAVALVEWDVADTVLVTGTPVPNRLPAGGGPDGPAPALLVAGLVLASALGLSRLRRGSLAS